MTTEPELDKDGVEAAWDAANKEVVPGEDHANERMIIAAIRATASVPNSANYTPEQKEALRSLSHLCLTSAGEFTSAHAKTILAIMVDMERATKAATPAEAGDAGLVERLQYHAGSARMNNGSYGDLFQEAADAIARLSATPPPAQPGEFERGLEAAAKWHTEQADKLKLAQQTITEQGGWIDSVRRTAAEAHRRAATAILALKPGGKE